MEEQKYVTAENYFVIEKGWYRYEDGTFSKLPNASKKIVGVVGLVDLRKPRGQRIKSIGLKEVEMRWSNKWTYFCNDSIEDGLENTKSIFEEAAKDGIETAAEWCVQQGGYLEAIVPLKKCIENYKFINLALEKIDATPIDPKAWYGSSSEQCFSPRSAWAASVHKDEAISKMKSKTFHFRFRCVFSD